MSSVFVRDSIRDFLDANSSETIIELDGEFSTIQDLIDEAGIGPSDPWVGLQYVGSEEIPVSITSGNLEGKYRETGVIFLHTVAVSRLGGQTAMLARAEVLRSLFRGQRINDIILIEDVTPPNFGNGAALSFEGGYTSCVVSLSYKRDFSL